MAKEESFTPGEEASAALASWRGKAATMWASEEQSGVAGGVTSTYLRRAREDAALTAFGDIVPNLPAAERFFREDGVDLYLKHQKSGTEGSAFFKEFVARVESCGLMNGHGIAGIRLGTPQAVSGEGFWPRLESRVDGVRDVFQGGGLEGDLVDLRKQNMAIFTSSVVAAGELVGRGRVDREFVLPVRVLDTAPAIGEMRATAVASRCAKAYNRALESVSSWERSAEALCAKVKTSATSRAIAPVLVSARAPLSITEIKDAAGVSYNTARSFLEALREKGIVAGAEDTRGQTYRFQRSPEIARGRGAAAARRGGEQAATPLPVEKSVAERNRPKAR